MARHRRGRSGRTSVADIVRRSTNDYWVENLAGTPLTVTAGTPVVGPAMWQTNLLADYDAKVPGATVMGVVADIWAAPTTAPAAGTESVLLVNLVHFDGGGPIASVADPLTTTGRSLDIVYTWSFATPFAAAPVSTLFNFDSHRHDIIKSRRILKGSVSDYILAFNATATTGQVWKVQWRMRALIRVP